MRLFVYRLSRRLFVNIHHAQIDKHHAPEDAVSHSRQSIRRHNACVCVSQLSRRRCVRERHRETSPWTSHCHTVRPDSRHSAMHSAVSQRSRSAASAVRGRVRCGGAESRESARGRGGAAAGEAGSALPALTPAPRAGSRPGRAPTCKPRAPSSPRAGSPARGCTHASAHHAHAL